MDIYIDMLTKTERYYNQLEASGVSKDNPYMVELRELMEKTIEIIKSQN